jgi:hypothetical protein
VPNLISIFHHLGHLYNESALQSPRLFQSFRNRLIFYGEKLLAPRPTPKLEDHPLLFVHGCLFNIFSASPHSCRQPEDEPCCGDKGPT